MNTKTDSSNLTKEFDELFDTLPRSLFNNDYQYIFSNLPGKSNSYRNCINAITDGLVFNEALESAVRCINRFDRDASKQYLIFSGTQAGKTNFMTTFATLFKDYIKSITKLKSSKKTSVYIFGPSPQNLKKQTISRFIDSELYGLVYCYKTDLLRYVTPNILSSSKTSKQLADLIAKDRSAGNGIVFFFDEAHEGSGLGKDSSLQKLQQFCKDNSIPLMGQKQPEHRMGLEVGLQITATPAHILQEYRKNKEKFNIVALKPGKGYYGIIDHDNEGRILDVKDVPSIEDISKNGTKGSVSRDFFVNLINEYIEHNKSSDDSGHIIFRHRGKKNKKSPAEVLSEIYSKDDTVVIKEFSCHDDNLKELNEYISNKPKSRTTSIIFVKQALGRGVTLDSKANIQLCFENRSNDASTIQSLSGRLTGYNLEFHEKLKIYTDVSSLNSQRSWLELYNSDTHTLELETLNRRLVALLEDPNYVQSGTHVTRSEMSFFDVVKDSDRVFYSAKDAKDFVSKNWPNYLVQGKKLSVSHTRGNNVKNVVDIFLSGKQNSALSGNNVTDLVDMNCGYRVIIVCFNGANKNFRDSWDKLKSLRPDLCEREKTYVVRQLKAKNLSSNKKSNSEW